MASSRRRRSTTPKPEVSVEPTHEEMLEVAAEREAEGTPDEVIMSAALADVFETVWEEEKEEVVVPEPVVQVPPPPPAPVPQPVVHVEPQPFKLHNEPRYLLRNLRHSKYRRG